MERLANYQQMVDPTMVWGAIKSNDAVRMDVSFTWKKEEWLIPAVFPIPGGLVVDVARKLPYYHLKNRLTIYEKHRNAGFHSPLERLMMDQYDPFHFHPMGHLLTGNDCIDEWRSERFIWNPLRMSPIASKEHYPARRLLEHYGLDLNTGWDIFRLYFKSELLSVHDRRSRAIYRVSEPDHQKGGNDHGHCAGKWSDRAPFQKTGACQISRQLCDPSLSLSPGEKGTAILPYGHSADR